MHLPVKRQGSAQTGTWKRSKINAQEPRTSFVEDEVSQDVGHPGFSLWSSSSEDELEDGEAINVRNTDDQHLLRVDSLHEDALPTKISSYPLTETSHAISCSTIGKSSPCSDSSDMESPEPLQERPRGQQKIVRLHLPKTALEHMDANEIDRAASEWLRLSEDIGRYGNLDDLVQDENNRHAERSIEPPNSPLNKRSKRRAYSEPPQSPFPKRTTQGTSEVAMIKLLHSTDTSASGNIGSYVERELRLRDEKVDNLQAIVDEKHRDLAAREENLHRLNLSLDKLSKQYDELIEDRREKEWYAQELRDRISEMEKHSQDCCASLCEASQETCELRTSLEESRTETAALRQDLFAKACGLDQLQEDLDLRSHELDELRHQQALQDEKMSNIASEVNNRNSELERCQAELSEVKCSSQTVQSVVDKLRKESDAKSAYIDQLQGQIREINNQLVQYRNEKAELLGHTRRSDDHVKELQQLHEADNSKISDLITELSTRSGAFRESCDRISRLESQIETDRSDLRQMEEGRKKALDQVYQLQCKIQEVYHKHNHCLELWKLEKLHLNRELEGWKERYPGQGQIDERYSRDTERLEQLSRQKNDILDRYEAGMRQINSVGTEGAKDPNGENRERSHGLNQVTRMTDNSVAINDIHHTPQPLESLSSNVQAEHPRLISDQGAASMQSIAQAASVAFSRPAPEIRQAPSLDSHQPRRTSASEKCTAPCTASNPQSDPQRSRENLAQLPRPDPQVRRNEDSRWTWISLPSTPPFRRT